MSSIENGSLRVTSFLLADELIKTPKILGDANGDISMPIRTLSLEGGTSVSVNLAITGSTDIPISCESTDSGCAVYVKDNNSSDYAGMFTYGASASTNDRLELRTNNIARLVVDEDGLRGYKVSVETKLGDDALVAADSGRVFVFTDAAATLTLPDSGAGDIIGTHFKFVSNFQGTGQKVVCADTTNEDMVGNLIGADDDGDGAPLAWNAAVGDTFSSINMNSVAQGKPGSVFTVTNIAADLWLVEGVVNQSGGSEATPFATT